MTLEKNIFDLSNLGTLSILEGKKDISSLDLKSDIHSLKKTLEQKGIGPGHKVVLCLSNSKIFCEYLFAIWELGACVVPISPLSTHPEVTHFLQKMQPSAIVYADHKVEFFANFSLTSFENILVLHTSGSSGKPKGVVLSRQALEKRIASYKYNLPLESFSTTLCLLPLNFGHGLISNFLFPILNGQNVILAPSGKLEIYSSLGDLIDEYGVTCFSSVPSILKICTNFSDAPKKKTLEKIFCASAPLGHATWMNTYNWSSGIRANNMYGMTELASWIGGNLKDEGKIYEENSFDHIWGTELKVVKENETDEYGEILVKSESMMNGYYEDQISTEKVLSNGWFKTGDLGIIASEKLVLKGRKDNVINLGGIKIYPEEINQLLRKHPKIQDCYVVGLKLEANGGDHGIGCILIPIQGEQVNLNEIHEMCKVNLSAYKIPTQFKILEKMPFNERGKADLNAIKQIFQSK